MSFSPDPYWKKQTEKKVKVGSSSTKAPFGAKQVNMKKYMYFKLNTLALYMELDKSGLPVYANQKLWDKCVILRIQLVWLGLGSYLSRMIILINLPPPNVPLPEIML